MKSKKKFHLFFVVGMVFSQLIWGSNVMAAEVSFPKHYTDHLNGVDFDTEIDISEALDLSSVTTATGVLQTFDMQQALEALASEEEIAEKNVSNIQWNGKNLQVGYYTLEDGTVLNLDTSLTYTRPFFYDVLNAFRIEKTDSFNAGSYEQNTSFSFDSPDRVFQEITEKAADCGFHIEDADYVYYALDADVMQQEEIITDKSGNNSTSGGRVWSPEDDSYYFFAEQQWGGIPVYYGTQMFPDDGFTNRPIQAVYSSRGLERLYINNLYEITSSGGQVDFLDFKSVAETVADKYGNILTAASYEVNRARLYQMPSADMSGCYEFRPVWLFEVVEKGFDSETENDYQLISYTFVDAETGEEVTV